MALKEAPAYKRWDARIRSNIFFILVHGLGAHAGRWEDAGRYFAARGIDCYAPELGTFGNFRDCYAKILAVRGMIKFKAPSAKIILVGESMGAVMSLLLARSKPGYFAGLVCVAPAFSARYKPSLSDTVRMLAPLLYDPEKRFDLPFDTSMCTRDAAYREKMDNDSREYRHMTSRLILEMLIAQARARAVRRGLPPALFLLAGDDKIVDPAVSKKVFARLETEDKTLLEYPEMYHSLTVDIGKEKVFEDMADWAEKEAR